MKTNQSPKKISTLFILSFALLMGGVFFFFLNWLSKASLQKNIERLGIGLDYVLHSPIGWVLIGIGISIVIISNYRREKG